jgi:Domain of unknown function (DUF4157)
MFQPRPFSFAAVHPGPGNSSAVQKKSAIQCRPGVDAFRVDLRPKSGGWPLPRDVQAKMEAAFGANFSDVRVHVGPEAPAIGAIAFSWGSDLHFAPGQYNPHTPHGQFLLGHELAHVVQQRAGRVPNPFGSGVAVVQDQALEAEADRLGRMAATSRPAEFHASASTGASYAVVPKRDRRPAATRWPSMQRKATGVVQRWPDPPYATESLDRPNALDLESYVPLSLDTPVVRYYASPTASGYTPVTLRREPSVEPPVVRVYTPDRVTRPVRLGAPIPQPVRIFDIGRRNLAGLVSSTAAADVLHSRPISAAQRTDLRAQIEEELEANWRSSEEAAIRARYNEVHNRLVDFKYRCLAQFGLDPTVLQFSLLDGLLILMSTQRLYRTRLLLSASDAREKILSTLQFCEGWMAVVFPALKGFVRCQILILDIEQIAEQLQETYDKRIDLYARNKLGHTLKEKLALFAPCVPVCPEFWKAAITCDTGPTSFPQFKKRAGALESLESKLVELQKVFNEIGGDFEDALERTPAPKAASVTLTPAERAVVNTWIASARRGPIMDAQAKKVITVGDFEMLRELTKIVTHIRGGGGSRYGSVDIHPHPLVGGLKGAMSYDFPFLNKDRLGLPNRGVWRIFFQGASIYGVFDDHGGGIEKWKGEGLRKTAP